MWQHVGQTEFNVGQHVGPTDQGTEGPSRTLKNDKQSKIEETCLQQKDTKRFFHFSCKLDWMSLNLQATVNLCTKVSDELLN